MNRLIVLLLALLAFAGDAHAQTFSCSESTSSVCNWTDVPGSNTTDAINRLYYRPSIISSWRLAQSPGTTDPRFVVADGTATTDDFMSGIVMPAAGIGVLLRVNQTGGNFAVQYTLQVNGSDTDFALSYDEFSPTTNDDVSSYVQWEAGDVLALKVVDATEGEPTRTYITLSGYFL
jgi:hypothetical protein